MMDFIVSGVVGLLTIIALGVTIKIRKKLEISGFLFLVAFEVIVILAVGWVFVVHGAIIEMGNMKR